MNAEATVLRERSRTRDQARRGGAAARAAGARMPPDPAGTTLAAQVMAVPLRVLARPEGRRISLAAALSLLLVALVSGLYSHADGGSGTAPAAARVAAPKTALAAKPASALAASTGGAAAGTGASGAGSADAAAVAWYAAQQHVPVSKVQALQHRQVSASEVEVMVTADTGATGIYSDMVTVRRVGSTWKVP